MLKSEPITIKLTRNQSFRLQTLGLEAWQQEELTLGEIARRLLLEYLLWQEQEKGLVGKGHWADAS